jgi:hypothetical protein
MCCLCFSKFPLHDLYQDVEDGSYWDACIPCAEAEKENTGKRKGQ